MSSRPKRKAARRAEHCRTPMDVRRFRRHCRDEGIPFERTCAMVPCWRSSGPKRAGVESALVRCDLVLRSDGGYVLLDRCMGGDSTGLLSRFSNQQLLGFLWDGFVAEVTELPS